MLNSLVCPCSQPVIALLFDTFGLFDLVSVTVHTTAWMDAAVRRDRCGECRIEVRHMIAIQLLVVCTCGPPTFPRGCNSVTTSFHSIHVFRSCYGRRCRSSGYCCCRVLIYMSGLSSPAATAPCLLLPTRRRSRAPLSSAEARAELRTSAGSNRFAAAPPTVSPAASPPRLNNRPHDADRTHTNAHARRRKRAHNRPRHVARPAACRPLQPWQERETLMPGPPNFLTPRKLY